MRKEPYIDLFFKLAHKAPKAWCDDFNQITSKEKYAAKIAPDDGLFIESWVRTPDEIEVILKALKKAVELCSENYIARITAEMNAPNVSPTQLADPVRVAAKDSYPNITASSGPWVIEYIQRGA